MGVIIFRIKRKKRIMDIKEKIKREIDLLPDDLIKNLQMYLATIKARSRRKRKIPALKLKGQYDRLKIRQKAYE